MGIEHNGFFSAVITRQPQVKITQGKIE